jgi:hypothetical protein
MADHFVNDVTREWNGGLPFFMKFFNSLSAMDGHDRPLKN